jgi:hypothetical protein
MNYYIDTEFIEDFISGINIPSFKRYQLHYIDLISIGIAAEDGREYYAVNKEFDLKHVWNKHDLAVPFEMGDPPRKVYWLRDNVLKPIYHDLCKKRSTYEKTFHESLSQPFSYRGMKYLIENHGKTRAEIAKEIQMFTAGSCILNMGYNLQPSDTIRSINREDPPTFYAYYADYDWVVFCSLFGRMLDLPKGYPMYCRDLKQMADEFIESSEVARKSFDIQSPDCHHALVDARWNKLLHEFLKKSSTLAKTTTNETY